MLLRLAPEMAIRYHKKPWQSIILLACLALVACSGKIPGVYSIPIQQGNVVTVEMLQELKLGMDKRKVTFILGTPLVIDAFHLDRWDYFYSYNPGGGDTVQQRASLFFEDERLARIDADIDSDIDYHTVTHATDKVLIVPPKKSGGFFAAITPGFLKRDEEEQAQDEIERTLATGFNEALPAPDQSAAAAGTGEVIDPAIATQAAIEPGVDEVTLPSEIYAPNSPVGAESAGAVVPAAGPVVETLSAETRDRSQYLEQLFDNFGAEATPPAAKPSAVPSAPADFGPRDPTRPTRD